MWTSTARCQMSGDEDYGRPGYDHTYPYMEEDAYCEHGWKTAYEADEDQEDADQQDLAGRAVVSVLEDPVSHDENVPATETGDEFDAYTDETADAAAQADEAETLADPWQNAHYGYDYDYSSSANVDSAQETVDVSIEAGGNDDDPAADFDADYGESCQEELDAEAASQRSETETQVETQPIDDSWKAARYRYIYGDNGYAEEVDSSVDTTDEPVTSQEDVCGEFAHEAEVDNEPLADDSNVESSDDAQVQSSVDPYGYRYAYGDWYDTAGNEPEVVETGDEQVTENAVRDIEIIAEPERAPVDYQGAYGDWYDMARAAADAMEAEVDNESTSDQDDYASEYSAWYDTACDEAEAVEADANTLESNSVTTDDDVDAAYDHYGYETAYGEWYDTTDDVTGAEDAEVVETEAEETADVEAAYDPYGYDAYGEWYDTTDDVTGAEDAEVVETEAAETADVEAAYDPYGYDAYGEWYDTSDDVTGAEDAEVVETEAEETADVEAAYDPYDYDACGEWYDTWDDVTDAEDADVVETDAEETDVVETDVVETDAEQAADVEADAACDAYDSCDYASEYGAWYDAAGDEAEAVEADANTLESDSVTADDDAETASDPYGYEAAYGDWYYQSEEDVDAAEANADQSTNQPLDQSTRTYPYPYGYGYEYEYDWQKPGKTDSAGLGQPTEEGLSSPASDVDLDWQQLAELAEQIVQTAIGSELGTAVRRQIDSLGHSMVTIADHADATRIWQDVCSSMGALAQQPDSQAEANVFLFEFDFEQHPSDAPVSTANESPWDLSREVSVW